MIVLMDIAILGIGAGLVGAVMGSFAAAQVWRLRAAQLVEDKKAGEKVNAEEYKRLLPLTKQGLLKDRSIDLDTGTPLKWYDLVPIISWLILRGRSRYSGRPIGWMEFVAEVIMAALFVAVVLWWPWSLADPLEWLKLGVWLVALVALAINFMYDARWFLLVSGLNWLVIGCGVVFASIVWLQSGDIATVWSILGSVAILGGLYGALWLVSRGKWVGEGDIYLGTGLALLLADWRLAFVALFAANLVGTLVIIPQLAQKKLERGSHVPFGPLLIIGFVLAWFFGNTIIEWYLGLVLFS